MIKNKKVRKSSFWHSVILVTGIAALLFEQSPANEALRAIIGFKVLEQTNNPLVVGSVVAGVTLLIELTSSSLIALGLAHSRYFKRLARGRHSKAQHSLMTKNTVSDYMLALGIGAGMLVIKKHLQNSRQKLKDDLRSALKAATAIAVFSGCIGFLAGGGVELARRYGFGTPAQYFLDVATDWRFWLTVVVVSQSGEYIRNRYKRLVS